MKGSIQWTAPGPAALPLWHTMCQIPAEKDLEVWAAWQNEAFQICFGSGSLTCENTIYGWAQPQAFEDMSSFAPAQSGDDMVDVLCCEGYIGKHYF